MISMGSITHELKVTSLIVKMSKQKRQKNTVCFFLVPKNTGTWKNKIQLFHYSLKQVKENRMKTHKDGKSLTVLFNANLVIEKNVFLEK